MKIAEYRSKIVLSILLSIIISLCIIGAASSETTTVQVQTSQSQLHIGDTFIVNIKIVNAQNLYGVDVTLNWNSQVLQVVSATPMLGVESHPDGVLHESDSYPIDVEDNSQSTWQYHLLATSIGASTPSFSGSGTIATVTFKVNSTGDASLLLDAELAVRGSDGSVSLVEPSTSVDPVVVVVPEFPTVTLVAGLLIVVTATLVLATKLQKRKLITRNAKNKFI